MAAKTVAKSAGKASTKTSKKLGAKAKPSAAKGSKTAASAKSTKKAVSMKPAAAKPAAKATKKPAAGVEKKVKVAKPAAAVKAKPVGAPVAKVAPVEPPKAIAKPAVKPAAAPVVDARQEAEKKKAGQRHGFRTNEYVVYPSHGVGKIVAIEEQTVAGHSLELFVINFEQEKMTLRVPTAKLAAVGMRKLAEEGVVRRAMETLKGRARIKRTMWSRRAQEYEAKINSGDLVQIAEVVRDLYRAESQPEQSYSERQLFEAALDRMAREIAAIDNLDERGAVQKITDVLSKSARGRRAAEEAAAAQAGQDQAA